MRLSSLARVAKSPYARRVVAAPARLGTFPAPTRGWNARDPLGGMQPTDAVQLDNYFPTTADVELRGGTLNSVTGMTNPVETLAPYSSGSARKLWAFSGTKIYDASVAGAAPAASVTGLTNARWQFTQFSTSGAHYLPCVNGVDKMQVYNGSAWQQVTAVSVPIAITGVDTATLAGVWVFKKRLFFVTTNTMSAWYLAVDSIGGIATALDLGPQFKLGGYLMAGGTWTRDGGDGMDDLCVFVSSMGEVLVYQGDDPSDAAHWALIGRYTIGSPIGRRCLIQTGADLAIISIDGIAGLSQIISLDRAATNKVALSDRIRNAFNLEAQTHGSEFGWCAESYPRGGFVVFNIPQMENSLQYQFVLNTTTGAWCRFLGQNANCWALFSERLYFGDNSGNVVLADEGQDDNGNVIEGTVFTAFQRQNGNSHFKKYEMLRPIVLGDVGLTFSVSLQTDFDTQIVSNFVQSDTDTSDSDWNVATWNVSAWATEILIREWRGVTGQGTNAAAVFQTSTKGFSVKLNTIDSIYSVGGLM